MADPILPPPPTDAELQEFAQRMRAYQEDPDARLLDLVLPTGKTLADTTEAEKREFVQQYPEMGHALTILEMYDKFQSLDDPEQIEFVKWTALLMDMEVYAAPADDDEDNEV